MYKSKCDRCGEKQHKSGAKYCWYCGYSLYRALYLAVSVLSDIHLEISMIRDVVQSQKSIIDRNVLAMLTETERALRDLRVELQFRTDVVTRASMQDVEMILNDGLRQYTVEELDVIFQKHQKSGFNVIAVLALWPLVVQDILPAEWEKALEGIASSQVVRLVSEFRNRWQNELSRRSVFISDLNKHEVRVAEKLKGQLRKKIIDRKYNLGIRRLFDYLIARQMDDSNLLQVSESATQKQRDGLLKEVAIAIITGIITNRTDAWLEEQLRNWPNMHERVLEAWETLQRSILEQNNYILFNEISTHLYSSDYSGDGGDGGDGE